MKVKNLANNQFMIEHEDKRVFSSYGLVIAIKEKDKVYLDSEYYKYSKTTVKYRNIFLGMTSKEVDAMVNSGEFELKNLNE